MGVEFRLLGPFEVVARDGHAVELGKPQQRAVAALLALRVNEVVSVASICEALWGDEPPKTAANVVQGHVSALRRVLEGEALIETVPPGYRLAVDGDAVDVVRFEKLAAQGRRRLAEGRADEAENMLAIALTLCRGSPLGEFADLAFGAREVPRLERLARDVRSDWVAARLERGDAADVVAELERLVVEDQYDERLWALLMTALYRAGRQADALAAYQRARRLLVDDLGVEPGPELRDVEAKILRQDLEVTRAVPRGLVTFLLTDVEGSNQLWERRRDEMADALARHDELVTSVVARHRGLVRKTRGEGDSTFSVFGRAADALGAALELQRSLTRGGATGAVSLSVRAAVHTGEADLRDGDYYGPTVNRAARLRGIAHGGQVLVTESCAALARDDMPDGASLVDLGSHRLKDIDRPEQLYQLGHADLRLEFPRLGSVGARTNLPGRWTSFLGRGLELADVADMLETTRLVTLTGPGGCGKTSLAVAGAASAGEAHPDGVWFVDLSPVSDPELVAAAVAAPVGVRAEPGKSLAESVCDYLAPRRALVVLDNCEQVVEAAAVIVEQLLRAGPGVRVLATSRERLGVPGEVAWPVPPLADADAVDLFVSRAGAAAPDVVVDSRAPEVAELCRRLDGVPLAIELAAARVNVLSVRQLVTRLDDALQVLGESHRTAPLRQRTLRATIEWSYELLPEPERVLFERLAVFAGGFTIEAVEAVAACAAVPAADVIGLFARLVDKSLVLRAPVEDGAVRYRLLETLRQFGLERLVERGGLDSASAAHAEHFMAAAEDAMPTIYEQGSGDALVRLGREADNFRGALTWAFADTSRHEVGCRLVGALRWPWFIEGRIAEGRAWADAALAATSGQETFLAGVALMDASCLASAHSDLEHAGPWAEEGRRLGHQIGSTVLRAGSAELLGMVRWAQGDLDEGRRFFEEAVEFHERYDDDLPAVSSPCPSDMRRQHERWFAGCSTISLGRLVADSGDEAEAAAILSRARTMAAAIGEDSLLGYALDVSATLAAARHDLSSATSMIEDSVAHYRRSGWREGLASGLNTKGVISLATGALAQAAASFVEALDLCRRLGHLGGAAAALEGLATVAVRDGDDQRTALLISAAAAIRERVGATIAAHMQPEHDRLCRELSTRLGPTYAELTAAGRQLAANAVDDLANAVAAFSERPASVQPTG